MDPLELYLWHYLYVLKCYILDKINYLTTRWFYLTILMSILFALYRNWSLITVVFRISWKAFKWAGIRATIDAYEKTFARRFITISDDKRYITVRYLCNNRWYTFTLPTRKSGVTSVRNCDGNSVIDALRPVLGPFGNLNGQHHTPLTLGYESLTFEYFDGTSKTFDLDDHIVL